MTRIAVVGGRLQGVEAAYLARRAGWEVLLVDRREDVPARGLCDRFLQADVTEPGAAGRLFRDVDLVLPALEDPAALSALAGAPGAGRTGSSLLFDPRAYAVSSSKLASNRLIRELDLPRPRPWPEGRFPLIIKPDRGSGSRGVRVCADPRELELALAAGELEGVGEGGAGDGGPSSVAGSAASAADPARGAWAIEEYIEGPSYSLEVLGLPGKHRVLQVTDLSMDAAYDCKRVRAPTGLPPQLVAAFERQSLTLAAALRLHGLMDVEVIRHGDELKVLEIDARLPSQTPIAVYWSTGVNMVEKLGGLFSAACGSPMGGPGAAAGGRGVVLEDLRVTPERVEVSGEHVMSIREPLHVERDFFGATEAITNYKPGRREWVATLIVTGGGREEAWERRAAVVQDIRRRLCIPGYLDPEPTR